LPAARNPVSLARFRTEAHTRHFDHPRGEHARHCPADRSDPASRWRHPKLAAQPQPGLWTSGILGVVLIVVLVLALTGRLKRPTDSTALNQSQGRVLINGTAQLAR